ncbi:lysozyme inhibitor LprI family protein [Microvirga sp. TS319]|uniref:lysozyme inhibitor LprI family protein n=1 Tax=Microvirga sp. TS319 TaxID=3241165 RepID=UPI00351A1DA0
MFRNALPLAVLALLIVMTAGAPARAASFDCAKAETLDEKAICADRRLNDDDVEMSVLYTQLKPLLGMGARGDLEDEQVAWLKRRAACKDDRVCLSNAYEDRLRQLRGGFEALARRGPF